MPRTLPAALSAVMDSGIYEPYIKVGVSEDGSEGTETLVDPLYYRLDPLKAVVRIAKFSEDNGLYGYFRLIRGAIINGSPVTISSVFFASTSIIHDGRFVTLAGDLVQSEYLELTADKTYSQVIGAVIEYMPNGTPSYEGTAAWKNYQFYPTGKPVILNRLPSLFTLLRQKYLVYATEDGYDGVNNNVFFFVATDTRAQDYTFSDKLFTVSYNSEYRRFVWTDEWGTIHTNGGANLTPHNLGYLHSTYNPPTFANTSYVGSHSSKLPVHLKRRTGDYVSNTNTGMNAFSGRVQVTEIFDPRSVPSWYQVLTKLNWFGPNGTPGDTKPVKPHDVTTEEVTITGPFDTTVEEITYAPLETGTFSGKLSATRDTNIQKAMETLDQHDHAADYAPIANGVTNGNSHDHNGGDGAQISHANLSNIGSNTHATIDDVLATGWIPRSEIWTRTGNHTFTVSGNVTTTYRKGTKIRYKDGGSYEYGVIASSSYSSPNTTVTLITNSDYAMAAATITDKYLSYIENPEGFPAQFNYTPTYSGTTSGTPGSMTTNFCIWTQVGATQIKIDIGCVINTFAPAVGTLAISLPFTGTGANPIGVGREQAVVGHILQAIAGPTTFWLFTYQNSSVATNGWAPYISIIIPL